MDPELTARLEQAIRDDGRYPPAAYQFLHEGLAFTTQAVHAQSTEAAKHVSGAQLCQGLRALALSRWGMLAPTVLGLWNVRNTRDFGEMVFLLIGLGLLGRQESDTIEDFDNVYDFQEAFASYKIPTEHFSPSPEQESEA